MTKKRKSHTPRSKEMLLPLPAAVVRDISLKNHLTLATLRSGHGTSDTMTALLRILYLTFYLLDQDGVDLALFLEVETALDACIRAAGADREWQLSAEFLPAIERVLQRNDDAVANVRKYRYVEAWNKLNCFVHSEHQSPLPGSRLAREG